MWPVCSYPSALARVFLETSATSTPRTWLLQLLLPIPLRRTATVAALRALPQHTLHWVHQFHTMPHWRLLRQLHALLVLEVVLVLVLPPLAIHGFGPGKNGHAPVACGLFALDDILGGKMPALPSFTQGVTIRVQWAEVQPTATTFNWTRLDQSVARAQAARRQLQFGVHPGASTPAWVYSAGAVSFPMLWNKPFSHGNCTTVPIPVPWDPIYVKHWTAFVWAFAKRYDHVAAVTGVKFAGLNAQSMENDVPAHNVSGCGGAGVVWDPSAIWQRLGYTPDVVIATFTTLIACYNTAWTNTSVVLMTGNFPWPAIDSSGQRTPRLDYGLSATLTVQFGRTAANGEVANNGLSATRAWSPPANLAPGV